MRIDAKATDEIGTLIDSFNRMTADLQSSKSTIESANLSLRRTNVELDRRRAYIETVVDTIAAGLLSIDKNGVVRYKQYVKEVATEPNYDEVLEAAKKAS